MRPVTKGDARALARKLLEAAAELLRVEGKPPWTPLEEAELLDKFQSEILEFFGES